MRTPRKSGKRTAFVPRIIFKAVAAVSVVPLCAACGGRTVGGAPDSGSDVEFFGVAERCFEGGCMPPDDARPDVEFTVAARCFEGGEPPCSPPDAGPDVQFTVAASCFDGGGFCPDAAGVADAGFSDVMFSVAADAFTTDS